MYRQTGRTYQAKQLEERVVAKRRNNPYYYLMLGNEAFKRSDLTEAIAQYNQAVQLDRQNHEGQSQDYGQKLAPHPGWFCR